MERWEKRDQDLYMKAGDNHMKINIGNLEFTELQDGVLNKALSDYPNVSDTEMKDSIDFVNYENIRPGVDKGNPQSSSFWDKNGFVTVGENQYIIMGRIMQNNRRKKI